jgi:hypothetical protein
MAISTYALISLAELKEHLAVSSTGQDAQLETVINDVTDDLERHLSRHIVTRGSLIEYHTMQAQRSGLADLRPRQWPIIAVTELCEDTAWPRTYPVASRLTAGTDYEIVKAQRDYIRRLSGGSWASSWPYEGYFSGNGSRAIRLTYSAGYATTAAVPARIKIQAKRYAALLWREIDRKIQGVQSQNDALGNFTRFAAAGITDQMKEALMDERRIELYETGEAA